MVCDGVHGFIYPLRGEYSQAGASVIAVIPFVGIIGKNTVKKNIKLSDEVKDVVKNIEKDTAKAGKAGVKINWNIGKNGNKIGEIKLADFLDNDNIKKAINDLERTGFNAEKYKALGYREGISKGFYKNNEGFLPEIPNGYYYREWDIIKVPSNSQRGIERIVTAHDSDGNVIAKYYTGTHYGDPKFSGEPFLKIK